MAREVATSDAFTTMAPLGVRVLGALTAVASCDIFFIYHAYVPARRIVEVLMAEEAVLLRFRDKDSREGISRATMRKLAGALDLSETAAIHRALVELAQRYVPQYAPDEGPLSEEQRRRIRQAVQQRHGEATLVQSLFDEVRPAAARKVKSRGRKRVFAARAR